MANKIILRGPVQRRKLGKVEDSGGFQVLSTHRVLGCCEN